MTEHAYKARAREDSHFVTDPSRFLEIELDDEDDDEVRDDPYPFGWREHRQESPDGSVKLIRTALTREDLLNPRQEDCVPEDTIHRDLTEDVAGILKLRYKGESTVAIWRNLKLDVKIPDLTGGPAPDLMVVEGVRDPKRRRKSFRLGKVAGHITLVMEVVSGSSKQKDYTDLPPIYAKLGVEEYLVLHAEGDTLEDVFDVRAWRRDPKTETLIPIEPDADQRLHLETVGLRCGTGPKDRGLVFWDAVSGERQRPPIERVEQAEERAEQEAGARKKAEQENKKMAAELERLRAQMQKSPGAGT